LYYIVLLLCYAQYLILETVVMTFVYLYCIVCFVCALCVFSDKFHVWLLYDRICGPTKWHICMYCKLWMSTSSKSIMLFWRLIWLRLLWGIISL